MVKRKEQVGVRKEYMKETIMDPEGEVRKSHLRQGNKITARNPRGVPCMIRHMKENERRKLIVFSVLDATVLKWTI